MEWLCHWCLAALQDATTQWRAVLDVAAARSGEGVRALLDCGALLSGTSNRCVDCVRSAGSTS